MNKDNRKGVKQPNKGYIRLHDRRRPIPEPKVVTGPIKDSTETSSEKQNSTDLTFLKGAVTLDAEAQKAIEISEAHGVSEALKESQVILPENLKDTFVALHEASQKNAHGKAEAIESEELKGNETTEVAVLKESEPKEPKVTMAVEPKEPTATEVTEFEVSKKPVEVTDYVMPEEFKLEAPIETKKNVLKEEIGATNLESPEEFNPEASDNTRIGELEAVEETEAVEPEATEEIGAELKQELQDVEFCKYCQVWGNNKHVIYGLLFLFVAYLIWKLNDK